MENADFESSFVKASMSRRGLVKCLSFSLGIASIAPAVFLKKANATQAIGKPSMARFVYVGTYSAPNFAPGGKVPSTAEGIYVYKMEQDGSLSLMQVMPAENPSFLEIDQSKSCLYAVNELGQDSAGKPMGRVSSYKIDQKSGELTFINTEPTNGSWPCHLALHPSGKFLFAANYGSGSFPVYPILEDGSIGKVTDIFQSAGNGLGADESRQGGPHAHMVLTNPGGEHVYGVDLGADKVLALDFDESTGQLSPNSVPYLTTASGSGPRHMVFHPNDQLAYVLNELSSSIDVFEFNSERGSFTWVQTESTLPVNSQFGRPDFDPENPGKVPEGSNTTAEIRIHPSGKWLYATNRGMNAIVVFKVNLMTGGISAIEWKDTLGEIPRGMNIDPEGDYLYVGNQNSDLISVFGIDQSTGGLTESLHEINSPVPVDFAFGPIIT
ncbi:lactonase family protein [Halomonas nitroreducens]|uniref:Lactonase family protein n=1 Tax=Halomonas nitroreducens TaxID=447425 RepID=A0A431V0K5_9GAMM|nr:lactonase family protein [Halomonas nitroreducens]RTQ99592.1 lactonase family protein [Halomonas nitroreducens]